MPTMCPDQNELSDLVFGRLNDDRVMVVAEHIDECDECRGLAVVLHGVSSGGGGASIAAASAWRISAGNRRGRPRSVTQARTVWPSAIRRSSSLERTT